YANCVCLEAASPRVVASAHARPLLYPLSLHDALPISSGTASVSMTSGMNCAGVDCGWRPSITRPFHRTKSVSAPASRRTTPAPTDRKSTRLNSSHLGISYAVFCLKKKNHHEVYCLCRG